MSFHNYRFIELATGVNGQGVIGDGHSATTVHSVLCAADGTVEITALGGGSATFALTAGQRIDVLCGSINVTSGTFVGIKSNRGQGPVIRG
jgi:hypothetical protein